MQGHTLLWVPRWICPGRSLEPGHSQGKHIFAQHCRSCPTTLDLRWFWDHIQGQQQLDSCLRAATQIYLSIYSSGIKQHSQTSKVIEVKCLAAATATIFATSLPPVYITTHQSVSMPLGRFFANSLWSHWSSSTYGNKFTNSAFMIWRWDTYLVLSGMPPLTIWNTSLSMYWGASSAINELVADESSEGFNRTVLPAAMAPA